MSTPPVLRRCGALLAAEGVALVLVGVAYAVATATGSPTERGLSYVLAALAVAGGVALAVLGRALAGRRGWARSPALVLQLLALPVGVGLLQGHEWAAGATVLVLALVTLGHLLAAGSALAADD